MHHFIVYMWNMMIYNTVVRQNLYVFGFRTEKNGFVVERFGYPMVTKNWMFLFGFQTEQNVQKRDEMVQILDEKLA